MIDLMRLRIFIHSAEASSFSQAAKELHIAQPTVSHHIMTLEKELGHKLFDRGGGKIHLTEAGRMLLPWARKLIKNSIELQEMMDSMQEKVVAEPQAPRVRPLISLPSPISVPPWRIET